MIEFLEVNIGTENKEQIISFVNNSLKKSTANKKFIVTLNQEILLRAERDETYREILNGADLKIVDSFGLKLVAWLKRKKIGERLAGADLAKYIFRKAQEKNLKICLVLKKGGWSSKENLKKATQPTKNLKILEWGSDHHLNKTKEALADREVLLVGLGAPDQEKLIWQIKDLLPDLKLAMGVGGTFDYWTGKKKRAPRWMQKIGMEWFWRLLIQPNRIFRIWNATVVFLWKSLVK